MAMVDVGQASKQACKPASRTDLYSPSRLAWSEGRRPLGAALHSSDEPGELSQ